MTYSVSVIKFATGEDFVHLIDSLNLLPHFDSTVFNMAMLRGRSLATNTIAQQLRAIKILLILCDMRGISLSTRMQNGFIFKAGELDELLRLCRKPLADIESMALVSKLGAGVSSPKRLKLFPSGKSETEVGTDWIVNRIIYIREYIDWLANTQCGRFTPEHKHYRSLTEQRDSVHKKLTNSMPVSKGRNVVNQRVGLDEDQQAVLWRVIDPAYLGNVWVGHHCRVRNELRLPSHRIAGAGITYRAFFNQLKQEYVYARWCLFEGVSAKEVHFVDREVYLESNADLALYSMGLEQIKTAFRCAYSLLDKVAYFINAYWNVGWPEKKVNFRNV